MPNEYQHGRVLINGFKKSLHACALVGSSIISIRTDKAISVM